MLQQQGELRHHNFSNWLVSIFVFAAPRTTMFLSLIWCIMLHFLFVSKDSFFLSLSLSPPPPPPHTHTHTHTDLFHTYFSIHVFFQVYISHKKSRLVSRLPDNVEQKPGIESLDGPSQITFLDGSSVHADSLMFCTGYHYDYRWAHNYVNIDLIPYQQQEEVDLNWS